MVISDLIYLTKLFIYSVSDGCKKKMGEKKPSRKKMDKRKKFVFLKKMGYGLNGRLQAETIYLF